MPMVLTPFTGLTTGTRLFCPVRTCVASITSSGVIDLPKHGAIAVIAHKENRAVAFAIDGAYVIGHVDCKITRIDDFLGAERVNDPVQMRADRIRGEKVGLNTERFEIVRKR